MPETVCDGEQPRRRARRIRTPRGSSRRRPRRWPRSAAACASSPARTGRASRSLIDLALAVTEAVTNCVVHAFVGREPGTVTTTIRAGVDELSRHGHRRRARDAAARGLAGARARAADDRLADDVDGHARAARRRDGADDDLRRSRRARAGAHGGARGRAARAGRAHRRGHVAGGGGRAARGPARPRARRRLRAGRDGRLRAPAALRRAASTAPTARASRPGWPR